MQPPQQGPASPWAPPFPQQPLHPMQFTMFCLLAFRSSFLILS